MKKMDITPEIIKEVLRQVKPAFIEKLGKYTHKRVTKEWYYHSLAFSHKALGYLFGFTIGFYKKGNAINFDHVGMNVVVRSNGDDVQRRKRFVEFFREKLQHWTNEPEYGYVFSERNGQGIVFPRYREIGELDTTEDWVSFLAEAIDELQELYAKIIDCQDDLFKDVVRAAPYWNEQIIEYAEKHIS